MKRIIYSILVLLIGIGNIPLTGQSQEDTSLVKNLRLNFAVPDMPAFQLLGTNPSHILRPSTPREFAVMASDFGLNNDFALPSSFAAEIAPFILFKSNNLTLSEYDKHSELYSLRVSVGT